MVQPSQSMTLTFRCPAELAGILPPPVPASSALPDWLKAMPAQAFDEISGQQLNTVKRCPPFVDAMTSGFLIPLMCDLASRTARSSGTTRSRREARFRSCARRLAPTRRPR